MYNFQPDWLRDTELQEACKLLENNGFVAYAVGGCVRDAIADVPCNDIDISTNAPPKTVEGLFYIAEWDVYPTGIDHGTLTVRKGNKTYEITTFRRDVATDGRRATVAFADTIEEDAKRRDFTMNALYMDKEGYVYDPTGSGVTDLIEGIVRFVGDAGERCREDYLRIMRLFRFHAKYGGHKLLGEEIDAAHIHRSGLNQISGERIWSELKKILDLPEPFESIAEMHRVGVLQEILPTPNIGTFLCLKMSENTNLFSAAWQRRFFALNGSDIPFPHAKAEKKHLDHIAEALDNQYSIAVSTYLYGEAVAQDAHALKGSCGGWNYAESARGGAAVFPVSSVDLMQLGIEPGPEMGKLLKHAKEIWVETSLTAEKEDLLEMVVNV